MAIPASIQRKIREFAKRFDLDGDGQLDENETQAMQSEIARMRATAPPTVLLRVARLLAVLLPAALRVLPAASLLPDLQAPAARGFGGGGPGGGGDRQARFQEMVKKYDSNGDGQLDDSDTPGHAGQL